MLLLTIDASRLTVFQTANAVCSSYVWPSMTRPLKNCGLSLSGRLHTFKTTTADSHSEMTNGRNEADTETNTLRERKLKILHKWSIWKRARAPPIAKNKTSVASRTEADEHRAVRLPQLSPHVSVASMPGTAYSEAEDGSFLCTQLGCRHTSHHVPSTHRASDQLPAP